VKITSPNIEISSRSANDEALLRCRTALDQKDREDYAAAQKTMRPFWRGVGANPITEGLDPITAADVLMCAGILTSWIGSKNQVSDAQEMAKDLLTRSISIFEANRESTKVAVGQSEIAYCYWREGAVNEARSWLQEALKRLRFEGASRARALLKLSTVEWTSGRFREALELLNQNESLFR